jgi:multidrug resistance efflux pump
MIVFLTLLYVGVLAVAVKIGLVKLNTFWKLSPLLWMLLLFVALFLPMQWGAPGGTANTFRYVVEIVPNVSGEVIHVPVKALEPLRKGDVLFEIDPAPFQAKVDQLRAQLQANIQNVEQLQASAEAAQATVKKTEDDIEIKKEQVKAAAASIVVAEASQEQAEANLAKATSLVTDLQVQVDASKRELDRQQQILSKGAGSKSDVDAAQVRYTNLLSQWHSAQADLRSAEQAVTAAIASLDVDKANANSVELELAQLVDAELPRVKAMAREAKLAAESMIEGEHTMVADVRAQLAAAEYELEQTTVRAPSKGHVAFLTLRPGQRVANLPVRSWMAFIDSEKTEIVVAVQQYALRNVRPGQPAEVTFKLFPGQVFSATVDRINYMTSAGQLQPSGQVASSSRLDLTAEQLAVVLRLDASAIDQSLIAGGAKGSAAIYTDSMKATHVIRRVMIRMDAWLNYVIP